jgi:hypothetical protein
VLGSRVSGYQAQEMGKNEGVKWKQDN